MNYPEELAIPDLYQAKRILCVQPHYDDNDIGAGGTIAALHTAGAAIIYLTVTDDLVGVIDASLSGEDAAAQLKREQEEAGAIIGVSEQHWLGYPDAGAHNYYELRRDIIKYIRLRHPDFVFTVDPWLPYEAHQDHVQVGRAVAEAALLHAFPRLPSDPEVDRQYEPYELAGIVFYFTHRPNTFFDITAYRERKHKAIDAYRAQFSPEDRANLHRILDWKERDWAAGHDFSHAEALKVLSPGHLHANTDAWRM